MILLGLDAATKDARIAAYCAEHGVRKVFILSPQKYRFDCSFEAHEHIEWADIIEYKFFYRLLQEIDAHTLVVVNECLRTQNRYDLTYNCMRHFLNQAGHQLVFQYLPLIDTVEDFMILFDFDTRSRWKREKFRPELLKESRIEAVSAMPTLRPIDVETDAKTRAAYAKKKRELIDGIGLKDPHTIPRNLYLLSGKAKLKHVSTDADYVGRNNRFKLERLRTYADTSFPATSTVFEFCHDAIHFGDFLALSRQTTVDVLVADLKVDRWYLARYEAWSKRLSDAYAAL